MIEEFDLTGESCNRLKILPFLPALYLLPNTFCMKEYMLLIRNEMDHQANWPPNKHQSFLKACEAYINKLKLKNNLISAQPLIREGTIISGINGDWQLSPFNVQKEVQVGYYHIRANTIEDAIEIAKQNPEFEFSSTARIEVRPLKMKEEKTGFIYPNKETQALL